ncbi:MAG: hypothetical protein HON90_07685 [Halobacteriovoraceae bacterium]|jgi:hypothetical protein|nr:hypothetical protein [Halobacteriovoraceae bacterium]
MESLLVWFFIFYFFSSRSIGNDFISFIKFIFKSLGNIFLSFFHFLHDSLKSRFVKRKRALPYSKKASSKNNQSNKKQSLRPHSEISVSLSRENYCPVNEFHMKLDSPVQQAVWRYYVDTNMSKEIQSHVVISLDRTAKEPKKWDITEDCLAMNIPLVWRIIQYEQQKLSMKGMIPFVLSLYGISSKKPA